MELILKFNFYETDKKVSSYYQIGSKIHFFKVRLSSFLFKSFGKNINKFKIWYFKKVNLIYWVETKNTGSSFAFVAL